MTIPRGPAFAGTLAVVVLITAAPAAQTPQQPIRSDASYVRVDVHPTSNGTPVADLRREDFAILEDGVPQAVETFEYVSRASAAGGTTRSEPGSAGASRQAVAAARGHVFVLFLDAAHVSSLASERIGAPLARLIDRIVGPDDLLGVMTEGMAASQVVFGRKTDVVRSALLTHPEWGRRFERTRFDERERQYEVCYPLVYSEKARGRLISRVAQDLVERRRERMTFDALSEIIAVVAATTQARTTVLAITEGWPLFQPDNALLAPRLIDEDHPDKSPVEAPPGAERIRVTPGGKLVVGDKTDITGLKYACETDRLRLAGLDDRQQFKDIIGAANRHNVSFYTIDPRGLAVFDTAVQSDPVHGEPSLGWDEASLASRQGSMRDLANNTDGLAVMDSLQLDRNLRRIEEDLASYYLIGYYSTNSKPDGKFRNITVRVKRPDVDVRARRGYVAPTRAEVEARAAAHTNAAPAPAAAPLPLPAPVLFRRGPSIANRLAAAEPPVFSRTERVRAEVRLAANMTNVAARFLSRTGQPIALPIAVAERTDADGSRWLTADATLAPLAPGDYGIELAASDASGVHTVVVAIRVTR